MSTLPNCEQAAVQDIKLLSYLLDEDNSKGKSVFFDRIGFNKSNYYTLSEAFKQLACSGEVIGTETTKFGIKYQVVGLLINPVGREVKVFSLWMIDEGKDAPRLITAYPF